MSKPVYIYALCEPDGNIRYIGMSRVPHKRLKGHVRDAMACRGVNCRKEAWIRSVRKSGRNIELMILEECTDDNWEQAERRHIAEHAGTLTNMAPGGVAPQCSCEQRKALAAKLHGRPDYPIMVAVRILTMWAKRYVKSGNMERAYKIVNMIVTLESSTGAARERLSVWAAERFMNGKKAEQHN